MAVLEMNYKSACLKRFVKIRAVLPFENSDFSYDEKGARYQSLYLLHGYTGNEDDWIVESSIVREARHRKIAIIMAAADNSFYHNHPEFDSPYADFIGNELVDITRRLFPLSEERKDTFIAGNSMGGYGALYLGSRYNHTFSKIAAFSGGFIHNFTKNDYNQMEHMESSQKEYFQSFFGKIQPEEKLDFVLAEMAKSSDTEEIYLSCGREDILAAGNRNMYQSLQSLGLQVLYREIPGTHDWDTWNKMLPEALDWMKHLCSVPLCPENTGKINETPQGCPIMP